jgi:hypothetical protein
MKSQDILLLLKLISLHRCNKWTAKNSTIVDFNSAQETKNVSETSQNSEHIEKVFSVRSLALETGISKSQISLSLNRSFDVGLAKQDRNLKLPKTNVNALIEFIAYGLRYVFPAKSGEVTRGIATSIAAPVLLGQIMTSGNLPPVWPDALGSVKGVAIQPLHKNIRQAVSNDIVLYGMLALTDAIRIGSSRERNLALRKLNTLIKELE